ncbi:hypothetical protein K8R32_03500 [bacterium]|nr:hypothetical protein [bacterium]
MDQIGPNTCSSRDSWRDPGSIYVFDGTLFRPILNENVYFALGYQNNWTDVVAITQDLFDEYGQGYIIDSPDDAWWITGPGGGGYLSAIPVPYNLTAEVLSSSEIKLDFYVPRVYTDYGIILYQDGIEVSRGYDANSVNISGIPPSTSHCFEIAIFLITTGEESTRSNMVCRTTLPAPISYVYPGSYVCDNWRYGEPTNDHYDLQPDSARTTFTVGENAYCLAKVQNIMVDHEWRVETYRNGVLYSSQDSGWRDVDEQWGWQYSDFTPSTTVAESGNYEFRILFNIGNGFNQIDNLFFAVTGTLPDFILSNSWTCTGFEDGPDPNQLVPVGAGIAFEQTDTVYDLVELTEVRVDHRFKAEVWKDGAYYWEDINDWRYVGSNTWTYSYYTPAQGPTAPSNYEFRIFLDTGNGFELIKTDAFTINASAPETIPWAEWFNDNSHGFVLEDHTGQASMYLDTIDGRTCLVIENNQPGDNWKVQVKKIGFVINQGTPYMNEVIIKADNAGVVNVAVQREIDPWDNFGLWQTINVTINWQNATQQFTADATPNAGEVRYTIMVGAVSGKIYIDYASLQP